MNCPICKNKETAVIDSRAIFDGIRRRRLCLKCKFRFTTYERLEQHPLTVIKRDGSKEPFSRQKIIIGLEKACNKRPISKDAIDNISLEIEQEALEQGKKEIPSQFIGNRVLDKLRKIDHVAYLRFASVYKTFKSLKSFDKELHNILE